MPSIPQSLLWISLVVLWLFVLVPMLISKRDAVRRTSDVALATRVLTGAGSGRLLRRGPAAGHRSDPEWRIAEDDVDDDLDDVDEDAGAPRRAIVLSAAEAGSEEPDYLDVDIVEEDSGALPVGVSMGQSDDPEEADEDTEHNIERSTNLDEDVDEYVDEDIDELDDADEPDGGEFEYVEDSSGLEAPSEAELRMADSLSAARRHRYESKTAAAVSARKFRFRKRMVSVLASTMLLSAVVAFFVATWAWWLCAVSGAATLLYLAYLRRQTRIEEQLRRRRAQRMARSRLGVENTDDRDFDVVPTRLRRPGADVLEIDDEDPIFEHLDYAPTAGHYDLPRAAGQ